MKNMKKLILVCGPAGIGKSTWCEAYKTEHPSEDVSILAADEVRKSMYGGYDKFPPDHNMMHVYLQMIAIATDLYNTHPNLTLILDTTMLYDERRLFFVRHLPKFDERILVLLKLHDYSKCLERNHQRGQEKWVPEQVILDMAKHYVDPDPDCRRHFTEVKEIYVD